VLVLVAADLSTLAPTGGVAGLVAVLMGMQYRSAGDSRRNEVALRAEFTKERAAIRAECALARTEDRAEIAQLKLDVATLRARLDAVTGR